MKRWSVLCRGSQLRTATAGMSTPTANMTVWLQIRSLCAVWLRSLAVTATCNGMCRRGLDRPQLSDVPISLWIRLYKQTLIQQRSAPC